MIPLVIWWMQRRYEELKEDRKEFLKSINQSINNRALVLERKLDTCEIAIKNIQELLKHRSEVAQLKYAILKDKIEDLERFSNTEHGYTVRKTRNADRSALDTMTDDSGVNTQIF